MLSALDLHEARGLPRCTFHRVSEIVDRFIKNIGNQPPITRRRSSEIVNGDALSSSQRAPKIKHRARGLPPSQVEIPPPASWGLAASAVYTNSARPKPTKNRQGNPRANAKNAHDTTEGPAHTSPTSSEFTIDSGLWTDISLHLYRSSSSEPLPHIWVVSLSAEYSYKLQKSRTQNSHLSIWSFEQSY